MSDDSDAAEVRLAPAELRRILHRYNNMTARILTRAEVALLEGGNDEYVAALEAIAEAAVALGEFTKENRDRLLGPDD